MFNAHPVINAILEVGVSQILAASLHAYVGMDGQDRMLNGFQIQMTYDGVKTELELTAVKQTVITRRT